MSNEKPLYKIVLEELDLSVDELSEILDINVNTLYCYSKNERVSKRTKLRLNLLLENNKLKEAIKNYHKFLKVIDKIN